MASRYAKRHYEDMATVLRELRIGNQDDASLRTLDQVAIRLARLFRADNYEFSVERFHDACDPTRTVK